MMHGSGEETEGVIKFKLEFAAGPSPEHPLLAVLEGWRQVLRRLELIGLRADRYDGLAYGNVSLRCDHSRFIISGTQTGGLARLNTGHYSLIESVDLTRNHVRASGIHRPSSEAMSHAALYAADRRIACVMHVHSPELWQLAMNRSIPMASTGAELHYGTPELAAALRLVARDQTHGVICMGGHQDGLLAYGVQPQQVALSLVTLLAQALALTGDD